MIGICALGGIGLAGLCLRCAGGGGESQRRASLSLPWQRRSSSRRPRSSAAMRAGGGRRRTAGAALPEDAEDDDEDRGEQQPDGEQARQQAHSVAMPVDDVCRCSRHRRLTFRHALSGSCAIRLSSSPSAGKTFSMTACGSSRSRAATVPARRRRRLLAEHLRAGGAEVIEVREPGWHARGRARARDRLAGHRSAGRPHRGAALRRRPRAARRGRHRTCARTRCDRNRRPLRRQLDRLPGRRRVGAEAGAGPSTTSAPAACRCGVLARRECQQAAARPQRRPRRA